MSDGAATSGRQSEIIESVELADGRELAWAEYGDRAGRPVIFLHGGPGSRLPFVPRQQEIAAEVGARMIAVERPGFGESTRHPARTLLGWADDVRALAEHLGLTRFSVIGFSAGGPHALACAAALGERLIRAVAVGCGAPWEIPELARFMDRQRRILRFIALRAPWLLRLVYASLPSPRRSPEKLMRKMLAGLPEPDREILARPEVFELGATYNAAGVIHGFAGMVDEVRLLARPWGFDLGQIETPVTLWNGSVDTAAPLAMAEYLAEKLPHAELRVIDGAGHLAIIDHLAEILESAWEKPEPGVKRPEPASAMLGP